MSVVIIGSGNWGTTLAGLINPEQQVRLWCKSADLIEPARQALRDISGADRVPITVETAFSSPLSAEDVVVLVVPSSQVEPVTLLLREHCRPPLPVIVTGSKGLERATFRTMSQVISAVWPEATVAVLSGPTIAREIAQGRPAKLVLGCENVHVLLSVAKTLRSDRLHLDMTRDKVDVELCAAMKGVFAIGAGVIAGRGLGCNDMGLLLTYGLKEMGNLAHFLEAFGGIVAQLILVGARQLPGDIGRQRQRAANLAQQGDAQHALLIAGILARQRLHQRRGRDLAQV